MKTLFYSMLFLISSFGVIGCSSSETAADENGKQEKTEIDKDYKELVFEDFTALEGIFSFYFKDQAGNEVYIEFRPMEDKPIEFLKQLYTDDLTPSEKFVGKTVKVHYKSMERTNEFTGEKEMVNTFIDVK